MINTGKEEGGCLLVEGARGGEEETVCMVCVCTKERQYKPQEMLTEATLYLANVKSTKLDIVDINVVYFASCPEILYILDTAF